MNCGEDEHSRTICTTAMPLIQGMLKRNILHLRIGKYLAPCMNSSLKSLDTEIDSILYMNDI